jgi:hypothetical protein
MAKKRVDPKAPKRGPGRPPGSKNKPKPGQEPIPIKPKRAKTGGRVKGTLNKLKPGEAPRTIADKGQARRDATALIAQAQSLGVRDIARDFDPSSIDWDRRNACERDLQQFGLTYLPNVFYLPPSQDHLRCIEKLEVCCLSGGKFALAMPRAQGKTAWMRAGVVWSTAYGHRLFPFFIGSTLPKATQTLDAIKAFWYASPLLRADFPEIAYPIRKLENRYHLARGQVFRGFPTYIEWGTQSVRYPALLFSEKEVKAYPESFITRLEDFNGWTTKNAGIMIHTSGIDGAIRGDADVHPLLLNQPRPDLVILDDIQKDQKADSPGSCDKIVKLIDGAIEGLAGPGQLIAAIMPCTVIREGDVSDTFLQPTLRPEWQGERCSMVLSWPEGITDYEISIDTEAGKKWLEYAEIRKKSFSTNGDISAATSFYKQNREVMDDGFIVSWQERFDNEEKYAGNREISPQQHAMNKRFSTPATFAAEYQNRPRSITEGSGVLITPAQLRERIIEVPRGYGPFDTHGLVAFIDPQDECLFWMVLGVNREYTGNVVDYGIWPPIPTRYYTKGQIVGWSLLSRAFFDAYPDQKDKAQRLEGNRLRAPFEAKIYFGVSQTIDFLLSKQYFRDGFDQITGNVGHDMRIQKMGVDYRWGKASDAIKLAVRNKRRSEVMLTLGQGISPAHNQYEEYERTAGWYFEDQAHPGLKECKWVWRPSKDGTWYLSMDVSRLKTFMMNRLVSPLGTPGAIALFKGTTSEHEMVSDHIAGSEYPEPMSARGRTKDIWTLRDSRPDNDWLDCFAGCMALASILGCRLRNNEQANVAPAPKRRKLSEIWKDRKEARR